MARYYPGHKSRFKPSDIYRYGSSHFLGHKNGHYFGNNYRYNIRYYFGFYFRQIIGFHIG